MADKSPLSDDRKPSVRIMVCHASGKELQPVLWGLEEEGIPADVMEVTNGKAVAMAKEAAHMSPLNVGIAIHGQEGVTVLHHRDLPPDRPLFTLSIATTAPVELRLLGLNAARLVKGEPLVLQAEPETQGASNSAGRAAATNPDELVELIVRSVLEELGKR
jgi:hypothetical protein